MHRVREISALESAQLGREANRPEVSQESCGVTGQEPAEAAAAEGQAVRVAQPVAAAAGGPAATDVGFRLETEMPIRTYSEANQREHFMAKARRAKAQRRGAYFWLRKLSPPIKPADGEVIRIRLTRLGMRRLDKDNLAGSFKHVQDGIADWIGIDDGSERLVWEYSQETGTRYAVRVCVEVDGE